METEIKQVIEDLNKAFVEFKSYNDERFEKIEKKGSADVLLTEARDKANQAVTELEVVKKQLEKIEAKASRPDFGSENKDSSKAGSDKLFLKYLVNGDRDFTPEERKAIAIGAVATGGYAVPEELDTNLLARLANISPMRDLCTVIKAGPGYEKLVDLGGTTSGWVLEGDARPETNTSTIASLTPFYGEVYAKSKASQQSLEDMQINGTVESWLVENMSVKFAEDENNAFLLGNGIAKPKGILSYTTAATPDSSRTFQQIQHIATGVAGDFAASNKADVFFNTIGALRKGYRPNAKWMMNLLMLTEIRTLKDSQGNYLLRPGLEQGVPSTLLGYGIEENEDMPVKAASSLSLLFGDFKQAYVIADRDIATVLRDPYTAVPHVLFYARKRVGGYLQEDRAIKAIKFSVS